MKNETTPAEGTSSAQTESESALRGAACSPPKLNIKCVCSLNIPSMPQAGGVTSLPVIRVEEEDDGSLTAVTDYWPARENSAIVAAAKNLVAFWKKQGGGNGVMALALEDALIRAVSSETPSFVLENSFINRPVALDDEKRPVT